MALKSHNDEDEREDKLRAYDGKDYSEIIDFPVELVDRDGVVRRYSYEESLAVYHRRIQSAPWRYGDDALIRAEIGHCTRRIDQIKRSYRALTRSGRMSATPNPRASLGEGYDVVRRHYERTLRRSGGVLGGELRIVVSLLQDEPRSRVYHVGFEDGGGGHLLYVYPFDRRGDAEPELAYREAERAFEGLPKGEGVERLLLAELGSDAGYLLTGTDELPEGLQKLANPGTGGDPLGPPLTVEAESQPWWFQQVDADAEGEAAVPFHEGVTALRGDRGLEALDAFREAIAQNPFHREAYLALLGILDGLGKYDEAEMYGEMARRHLPRDGLIRYRQGINFVRQGRLDVALTAFDEAAELAPALPQPLYFGAHVVIAQGGDLDEALRRMKAAVAIDSGERHLRRALRGVQRCVLTRRVLRVFASLLACGSVAGVLAGHPLAGAGVLLAGITALASAPVARILSRLLLRTNEL